MYKDFYKQYFPFWRCLQRKIKNTFAKTPHRSTLKRNKPFICIVIADKLDKMSCEEYWRNYGVRKHSPTIVRVMYPQEYANSDIVRCDATIVVGWLNSKNMKNVIYCYGSSEYTILTYACEEKWRNAEFLL